MENQHRQITGYRELNQEEINLMNEIKSRGEALGDLVRKLEAYRDIDVRWLAIGRTNLQHGIMDLVRSVARPDSF